MILSLILSTVLALGVPQPPAQSLDGLQGWVWDQVGADILTPEQAKRLWSLHLAGAAEAVREYKSSGPFWKSEEALLALLAALTGLFEYRVRKKVNDTEKKINRDRDRGSEERYYSAVKHKAQQETSNMSGTAPSWLKSE